MYDYSNKILVVGDIYRFNGITTSNFYVCDGKKCIIINYYNYDNNRVREEYTFFEIEDSRYESYKECIFGFDNMDIEDGGVTNSDGASVECKSIIIDDNEENQKLFDKNAREKIEELLVNANYCNFVNSVCFLAHFIPKELYPNYFKLLSKEIDFDEKTRIMLVYTAYNQRIIIK